MGLEEMEVRWSRSALGEEGAEKGPLAVPSWVAGRCLVVGAGPAGQVAAELLAESLQLPRAAQLQHAAFPPLAGAETEGGARPGPTPCSLLASELEPVGVVLMRSGVAGRLAASAAEALAQTLDRCDPALVFIMATADAAENSSVDSGPFRYICNDYIDDAEDLAKMGWKNFDVEKPNATIYGAKFAQALFKRCTDHGVPCIMLFRYCYEGISMDTASQLLKQSNEWIKAFKVEKYSFETQLKYPKYWKTHQDKPLPNLF